MGQWAARSNQTQASSMCDIMYRHCNVLQHSFYVKELLNGMWSYTNYND